MSGSIRKSVLAGLLTAALGAGCLSAMAQERPAAPAPPKLKVGDAAPEFKLQYFDGNDLKDVHLSDYKGKKNVVLAFYIFAFTGG
jgi:hypothetical protein